MKRTLLVIALSVSAALGTHAQNIAGDWQGTLDTGQIKLRLALHIAKTDGGYKATLDSIDQGANEIPVSSISLTGLKLNLAVDAVKGTYEGDVNGDATQISGIWSQGQSLPLNFTRSTLPPKAEPKAAAKPSDIDGTWHGTLEIGGIRHRVVFHIVNTAEGLTAVIDIYDLALPFQVRATTVTRSGQSLTMEIKIIGGQFEGEIAGDLQSIQGTWQSVQGAWSEGSINKPLLLKR